MEEALRQAEKEAEEERIKAEEGHVLCMVCGTTDNNYDDEEDTREMIQCDQCKIWQHSECMLSNPKKLPKTYLCNLCDPNNKHFKTLKYKLDPETTRKEVEKHDKRKNKKIREVQRMLNHLEEFKKTGIKRQTNDDDDDGDEESHDGASSDDDDDDDGNDNESDGKEEDLDEPKRKKSSTPTSRSRSTSSHVKSEHHSRPAIKKRKTTTPTPSTPDVSQIDKKAREAVLKRLEQMFQMLLPDSIPGEDGTTAEISKRWAKKLEEELFEAYHDRETGKTTKDYKELFTRIFSNVKDKKNTKLRDSIINREMPFSKLVRMPLNEMLNPELRKEREEAIKESMEQATLEQVQVSNIRRTHKGDVLIENEDMGNAPNQVDFNVGVHLDNDDEKFVKSESNMSIKGNRKHSIFDGPQQDASNDDDNDIDNDYHTGNATGELHDVEFDHGEENGEKTKSHAAAAFDFDNDDDLAAILGETKKTIEQTVESYDPTAIANDTTLWQGQTIFTGFTNVASTLHHFSTTLESHQFSNIARQLIDPLVPMEIEGRLDARTADDYVTKVMSTRKVVVMELKSQDSLDKNFKKLFDYFAQRNKFGVVMNKNRLIKDAYLFPISASLPKFMRSMPDSGRIQLDNSQVRLFVVFVVRQELISNEPQQHTSMGSVADVDDDDYDPSATTNATLSNSYGGALDFLSVLSPEQRAVVDKILDMYPRARTDPVFLIQQLQQLMPGA